MGINQSDEITRRGFLELSSAAWLPRDFSGKQKQHQPRPTLGRRWMDPRLIHRR